MGMITMEDINYLAQQSSGKINMILSGMTALMNDTDNKVAMLESQNWFQRMAKTVTGKNKLTQSEIQQNHDKLNAYMSEAIAELYNRNCIDHDIMISLGTQLNELYADHIQLKQMLGAFVSKLNEKIDSVDNFHMLTTEIEQGVYSEYMPITAICKVISQFDNRILEDKRKLDIIKRGLYGQNIINSEGKSLIDYLRSIVEIPMDEIGQIYLELGTIKGNFIANIILAMMEKYHFLPDMARKMKNKDLLIEEVIKSEGLDSSISLSIDEIYDDFISSKIDVKNGLIPIAEIQMESKLEEAEKLFLEYKMDEAFELFQALAEKGNARAMYFLGEFYAYPYGNIKKDSEKAKMWREKGKEIGDILSALNIAYSLPEDSQKRTDIFHEMFPSVMQLAEQGDVFAQNEVGDMYYCGYGTAENKDEGVKWWKKAAESGDWRSWYELGGYYYSEEQDYEEAAKSHEKAAKIGFAEAQIRLGVMYYQGKGVKQSYEIAFEWFKKAAEQDCDWGCYNLGNMYFDGDGIEQDDEKAVKWWEKAADLGLKEAQNAIGNCYYQGNGVEQNYEIAVEWYRKAAEQDYDWGCYSLGNMYYNGYGIEQDDEKAVKWYKKAADLGLKEAQNAIGNCYYQGNGVEQNYEIAVEWYKKAAEQDYDWGWGCYNLGNMYYNGYGIEQDDEKAVKWYKKAAENGLAVGQSNLSVCYKLGDGIEKNMELAKEWALKAAEQGNEAAKKNLQKWFGISM